MAANANLTYRRVVDHIETACNYHKGIAEFATGTLDYLDASAVNRLFPFVYLRPIQATLADKTRTLNFEMYVLDQPKDQTQNNLDVVSNTEFIIYDIMAYFNFGTAGTSQFYEVTLNSAAPVNEAFQDRLYGWVANINFTTPFALDYCSYPD